ncbi:hypothetical protein [Streptomyces sp. NPDC055632]
MAKFHTRRLMTIRPVRTADAIHDCHVSHGFQFGIAMTTIGVAGIAINPV